MNRRQLLRALGLTAGGLTSGALTRGSWTAHAQEAGPYKRLLVVSHCHGWTHETWRLQPSGLDRSTPWRSTSRSSPPTTSARRCARSTRTAPACSPSTACHC